ncbi:MAG: rod shape-determining protein MreD [Patescibacteria group bacterium]
MRKALLLILSFYILVLLQTSFLVHFNIFGIIPNFIIIAVVLINFFENPEKKLGIIAGFFGGIFLDIFSGNFLGFYTLILLAASLFLKYAFRRYIRIWT